MGDCGRYLAGDRPTKAAVRNKSEECSPSGATGLPGSWTVVARDSIPAGSGVAGAGGVAGWTNWAEGFSFESKVRGGNCFAS